MTLFHEDILLPSDPGTRAVARHLYHGIRNLPIVSPHGHADPRWFAENEPFPNPAQLFVTPDHYISRMLYSQGVPLEDLYVGDDRKVWRIFANYYYLFRATPTRLWLDFAFHNLFGLDKRLTPENADEYYDAITDKLKEPEFRPRALFERFRIDVLATTDSPLDSLSHHVTIRESGFTGRIIPTFRPDPVVDPDSANFKENIARLGQITGADTGSWQGYLSALRQRRLEFVALGCTATDHGHATAATADLDRDSAARLYQKILSESGGPEDRELFRAQMLTEMAAMSLDDKLVMQIHPGSFRNHNASVYRRFGRDAGADIPVPMNYVQALKPLLDRFGNESRLTIILFTLDESTYSRELAPLAGHYPCLRLGPAWWFHDSPEGIMRFRENTTETAGFYNTVGFNDDSRSFISIPARHDMARRVDCSFLARLVVEHRLDQDEALEVAVELAGGLARKAYRL
ncbi:MAG TPA: glucuronate isomerase [Candidatus Eisenbacteria bacterium]|jgi:glucuronate isomerase|nr:glucuronate isomerase [Candidatus Eisenbacteria bacterium]